MSEDGDGSVWTCGPTEFQCHDGACIDIQLKCDGQFDCTDKSDEYLCGTERFQTGMVSG